MATDARETKRDAHLESVKALHQPGFVKERRGQGKFKPLRRLFGKRKKRPAAERGFDAAELKASFSSEEVCNDVPTDDEETNQHLSRELHPVGSRSLSHDSVFIPEEPAHTPSPEQTMSQENVSDKVRSLQRQIAQNIKFGQRPPSLRKSEEEEEEEGSSDEEEVPRSPLKVLAQVEAEPVDTGSKAVNEEEGTSIGAHQAPSTPVKSPRSKRVIPATGTIESIDLDGVPQSIARLDNAAAKHKLSVKPKNQRISRKHRRFTQDLQEVDIHSSLQEEAGESAAEKTKKQKLQEEERLESQRKEEIAEHSQREQEDRWRKAEEWRLRELEEERCRILKEEDRRQREEMERRRKEEEKRMREEEEKRMREEEEKRMREEEEKRMREEEEKRMREEEEKRMKEEEEKRMRKEEEKRMREEEEKRMREELECMQREEEYRMLEEERRNKEEEKKQREIEAERLRAEEWRLKEAAEEKEMKKRLLEEKRKLLAEEDERLCAEATAGSSDSDKRRAEEVRWREMDERQRPFTFKVSSGEKQILFQKVNLTPVTPASSQQVGAVAEHRHGAKASSPRGDDSPTLPSSQYVPHTAILVTGAQLCGTAVNLDHIKETACKSLLGLDDEKKAAMGTPPPTMTKSSPDRKSGKTKSLSESTDQSSAAVLAEWASIRSKIFKGAEDGKYEDYPDPQSLSRPCSEDQSPFPHTNLRKTMSASAKFSITPARKKFADSSNRNSEVLSPEEKEDARPASVLSDIAVPPAASPGLGSKAQSRGLKTVRIADETLECMFAKDLPSFIVPSSCQESVRPESSEAGSPGGESEGSERREEGEEKGQPTPFGIKLRRTNYSLRFHSEQSVDKRKKRYSAGDSFDGVPSPLTPMDPDVSVFSDNSSPASPLRESIPGIKSGHAIVSLPEPRAKAGRSPTTSMHSEWEKQPSKASLYQRPSTSPNPATPPPSPVPKVARGEPGDAVVQWTGMGEDPAEGQRGHETSAVAQLHRNSQGEEEHKEKRSFFPSISIPWREKTDRKTELIRKDGKPSLQSRHSLDSARVQDKETGPLWITLALQKQKGFREQQQSRDERRCHRESKLSDRQAKEKDRGALVSHLEGKESGNISPPKPQTPEESKRPETLLCRLERREQLKKANTLPSSVTVEIADSTPSPPAVKEVTKRFQSTDSPQVSTEPAWLALAKRKAKAWSDCPQIIK
ncbi:hypothetical protein DPEC_G00340250 [Dallia pectoralis]|uniref:Uncharacterized protein n=1 Tax=Dallia pectoralis TaxID=75939 RepID=A0ACC2F520_DALPE|nr:hypothetical protein DPEC_G00340250 [Dallia pectoralis]